MATTDPNDPNNPANTGANPNDPNNPNNDTSVARRVTGLLDTSNPDNLYMQQAETQGLQQANQRGLLNSSIAVQAAQQGRVNAALPIAQQDASQANQRVMQGTQIQSTEGMQTKDIAAQQQEQQTGIAAAKEQQQTGIAATQQEQQTQIAADTAKQQADIQNQKWLAQFSADTQTRLQGLDEATRLQLQQLSSDSAERIANMNVSSNDKDRATSIAASLELGYQQMVSSITNNPDIPADARQQYLDQANAIRESNFNLIEQMYGINLDWTGTPNQTTQPVTGPKP